MLIRKISLGMTVLMALFIALPAAADRDYKKHDRGWKSEKQDCKYERRDKRYYEERGYRYDSRHRHNRYYPPRGHVIRALPRPHRVVPYRGIDYYFHSGIWYRRAGVSFSVVLPPIGIVVPILPPYYTRVWVDTTPYYYAGGVYYVWRPAAKGYVVTESPQENKIDQEPGVPYEFYIYPKKGQSEKQQATDRYECYRWASDQTGFDPTQPGGNVPAEQHTRKREAYQRAMKACLEGRNYSVK